MRKNSIVFAVLCVALLVSNMACADLIISITGPGGVKEVQPGTTTGEIWATVTGTDAAKAEGLTTVTGAIQLTGAGNFAPWVPAENYAAPFTFAIGAGEGAVDLSPDGKLLGHAGATAIAGSHIFYARTGTTGGEVGGGPFKLGTFTANLEAGDTVNFLKSGASLAMYTFKVDGTTKNGSTTGGYALVSVSADPLRCVPEPSTFILLGMGALALVFIRRRK
jgi:hypothetical protein